MKIRNALRSYGVISTMLLCMIGFILLHLGHRDLAFSEKENRVLQQRPAADMAAVFHGSFQKESEAWLRDQFDQRFALVQLHANLNYILGKRELQDVIIGQDGILFQKQEKPNQEQLRTRANSYMKTNNIGVPAVSLTVSFIQLSQSTEYAKYALLEDVHLCDTVSVEFPELNVSATAKCIKTIYDAISNKYVSIELGESRTNLASTISDQKQAISDTITKTFMQQAIENATKLISGGLGGYVIMNSSTGGKYPDEILIMDTDDIATAKKVWRWNKGGLGYSSTGYNGPFALAMTQDGQIVADFVKMVTFQSVPLKVLIRTNRTRKASISERNVMPAL